jgi:hypothetical protein
MTIATKFPGSIPTGDDFKLDKADLHQEVVALFAALGPNLNNLVKFHRGVLNNSHIATIADGGTSEFMPNDKPGSMIVPVGMCARYTFKTTPYGVFHTDVRLGVGYTGDMDDGQLGMFNASGFMDQSASKIIPTLLFGGLLPLLGASLSPDESDIVGSGLSVNISTLLGGSSKGKVVTAHITAAGSGYQAGDNITQSGDGGVTIHITTVDGSGHVTGFTISDGGAHWGVGDALAANSFSGGNGTNAAFAVDTIVPIDAAGDGDIELITAYLLLEL